jgi:hypothetical protein
MNRLILIAAIAALAAPAAFAQDNSAAPAAAPAAAAPVAAETVAPPACTRPTIEHDPKTGKILHVKELNKAADAYKACIDAYVAQQKADANAHYDAGDAANHQFNDFAKEMNAAAAEALAKQKADEEKQKQDQ